MSKHFESETVAHMVMKNKTSVKNAETGAHIAKVSKHLNDPTGVAKLFAAANNLYVALDALTEAPELMGDDISEEAQAALSVASDALNKAING